MHEQNGQLELELSTDHTYAEYTDLLQSWLFFDFIHIFYRRLGLTMDLREFVIFPVDGEPEITAATLRNSILTQDRLRRKAQIAARAKYWWKPKLNKLWSPNDRSIGGQVALDAPTDRPSAGNRALCEDIDLAHHHVNLFDFADTDETLTLEDRALRTRDRGLVALSIKYVLHQVAALVYSNRRRPFQQTMIYPHHASNLYKESKTHRLLCVDDREIPPPSAGIMQSYLESNGWCPVLARDLLCRQPLSHVNHAAAAIRYDRNFAAHDRCSDSQGCVAFNVNLDYFEPKHVDNCCCCNPVKPDIGKIYDILQRDKIPIARLSRDKTNRTVLEIVAASPDLKYTAISHVWADGLANAKYNGVFQCQLDKLFECVSRMRIDFSIPQSQETNVPNVVERDTLLKHLLLLATWRKRVTIWLDAICVPVLDPGDLIKSRAMKMRAINLMTPTYAGASHVLVLDHRVEQLSEHKTGLSLAMCYCLWMGRCWTLQEGALARTLFFQCSSSAVPVPHTVRSAIGCEGTQELIEALLSLSTSMKADMDQILANLSRLDANVLSQYSSSDRVKAFLLANADCFPIGLLLRHLEQVPDKPREEWWIPDLQSRASFYSSGWQSTHIVTLCDRGVLIRGHKKFWHEDMSEIRPCSIQLARNVGKTIWLENKGNMFWIVFDLGLESFARPATGSGSPDVVLLLPGKSLCKNARGFIGRGLCLTSTKREQTNITVRGSEHTVKAWPTLYNCAFSMGIKTPLSAIEFAKAPLLRPHTIYSTSKEDRSFLMEIDTVSWPRLQTVRGARNSWFQVGKVPGQDGFLIAVGALAGLVILIMAIGIPLCSRSTHCDDHLLSSIMLVAFIASFLTVFTIIIGFRIRNIRIRQRAFNRYVQSFSTSQP